MLIQASPATLAAAKKEKGVKPLQGSFDKKLIANPALWNECEALWSLQGDFRDITGNGLDATKTGTVDFIGTPKGLAAEIGAGSSHYLSHPQLPSTIENEYTAIIFMEVDAPPGGGYTQWVLANSSVSLGFAWDHANGSFRQAWAHRDSSFVYYPVKYTTTLQANTPYVLGVTWDGATVRAYLDGVDEAQANASSLMPVNGVGQLGTGAAPSDVWTVYGFGVWSRALIPAEMRQVSDDFFTLYRPFLPKVLARTLITAEAPPVTFEPAWARNANTVIGMTP